jgi:hypothetical protein
MACVPFDTKFVRSLKKKRPGICPAFFDDRDSAAQCTDTGVNSFCTAAPKAESQLSV